MNKEIKYILVDTDKVLESNSALRYTSEDKLVVVNDDELGKVIETNRTRMVNLYLVVKGKIKIGDYFIIHTHRYGYRLKKCKDIVNGTIICEDNELLSVGIRYKVISSTNPNIDARIPKVDVETYKTIYNKTQ